jgi:hypothetical protein
MGQKSWRFGRATLSGRWLRCALLLLVLVAPPVGTRSETAPHPTIPEIIRVLAFERAEAEHAVQVIHTRLGKKTDQFYQGVKLYNDAKSHFDGLIAGLRLAFLTNADPPLPQSFSEALRSAVDARNAFTTFVYKNNPATDTGRPRSAWGEALQIGPALIEKFMELIRKMRDLDMAERYRIAEEVTSYKWRSFNEITLANRER